MSDQNQSIPGGLKPYFQEYDLQQLDLVRDANVIIQRVLEYGTWDEIRWLFQFYGGQRIRKFVREYGYRWLSPVTFHFWRKLLRINKWKTPPFPTEKREIWNH